MLEQHRLALDLDPGLGPAEDEEVLHQPVQAIGLGLDIVEHAPHLVGVVDPVHQLGRAVDRRDRGPQLVGHDADERLAGGPRLPGRRDVTEDDDRRLAFVPELGGIEAHRIRAEVDPAVAVAETDLDRSTGRAQRGQSRSRFLEMGKELFVPLDRHAQDRGGGRVGENHAAVRVAHEDTLAHAPDDRAQLGRPGSFGARQAVQAGLDLDLPPDVAGHDDHPDRIAGQAHGLEERLHRDLAAVAVEMGRGERHACLRAIEEGCDQLAIPRLIERSA